MRVKSAHLIRPSESVCGLGNSSSAYLSPHLPKVEVWRPLLGDGICAGTLGTGELTHNNALSRAGTKPRGREPLSSKTQRREQRDSVEERTGKARVDVVAFSWAPFRPLYLYSPDSRNTYPSQAVSLPSLPHDQNGYFLSIYSG